MSELRTYDEALIGGSSNFDLLQAELSNALSAAGSTTTCEGIYVDNEADVGSRLKVLYSAALEAPEIAAADPVFPAHPTIPLDANGSIVVSSGVEYTIGRRVVSVGQVIVWDIHLGGYLGDQSDFQPLWIDGYPQVYLRSSGDVQVDRPNITKVGSIPGFSLDVTGTATEAIVKISMKKSGTLTIAIFDIDTKAQYKVPA